MIEFRNLTSYSLDQLSDIFNRCFEGYVIPMTMTPKVASYLVGFWTVDFVSSIVAVEDEVVAGLLLITRRGAVTRVGAMAIAPDYRSKGLGAQMMTQAISKAKERGSNRIELEAIEHNVRAIAFYERFGYKIEHRILGFTKEPAEYNHEPRFVEISFERLASLLLRDPQTIYSWETSPASALQFGVPYRAYELEGMGIAFAVSGDTAVIRALAISGVNDIAKLICIVEDIQALHPNTKLMFPPVFPEPTYRELLVGARFEISELSQIQMGLPL